MIKKALIYVVCFTIGLYALRYLHWKGLLTQKQGYYAKYRTAFLEKNDFDVLFLGSSRVAMHYNTALFDSLTGSNSFNLSLSGATPRVSLAVLKAYLQNSALPKCILLETDLHNVNVDGDIMEFNNYFPFFKNKTLLDEFDKIDPRMKYFYYNAFYSWPYTGYRNLNTSLHSWLGINGKIDDRFYKGYVRNDYENGSCLKLAKPYTAGFTAMNGKCFQEIITFCKQNNIQLILVSSPMFAGGKIDLLNKQQIVTIVDAYAEINELQHWNLSSTPYCNQRGLFIDHFHMNYKGARLFTSKLAYLYSNNCQKNALNP
ncbi:MAG: hypothetical protein SGJ15_12060 [Bacteroidota bacterium]|nr:hypothetical protein [Bacteroidota bacterium]